MIRLFLARLAYRLISGSRFTFENDAAHTIRRERPSIGVEKTAMTAALQGHPVKGHDYSNLLANWQRESGVR